MKKHGGGFRGILWKVKPPEFKGSKMLLVFASASKGGASYGYELSFIDTEPILKGRIVHKKEDQKNLEKPEIKF